MIILYLLLIVIFSLVLIKATDILIINLRLLARQTRLGKFVLAAIISALATCMPEFFVSLTSLSQGLSNLALGNIIGSNIADLSLVVGGAALIGGSLKVKGSFSKTNLVYAFLAGLAPIFLLWDRTLSRLDGLILVLFYGFYILWIINERRGELADQEKRGIVQRVLRHSHLKKTGKELGWIALATLLLIVSAQVLVLVAKQLALSFNISLLLIGLFLVAIGTSLPELVFSLESLRAKEAKMFFGDLLGSVVANGTLIIGIMALLKPIEILAFEEYLLATVTYVVIFLIFYFFIRTKQSLERWEGAFLIGFYLAFVLSEFVHP